MPNGNVVKQNVSFVEGYGKATYTVNDNFNFGGSIWGSPSVLNSGAPGIYYAGNVTLTAPSTWFQYGIGAYVSGDVGWWQLGTSDAFYGVAGLSRRYPVQELRQLGRSVSRFTWKAFTLDLRYYQSDLSKGDCNAFTSDHTASRHRHHADQSVPASGLQLVRCDLHRQAFVRHLDQRAQIDRANTLGIAAGGESRRPFRFAHDRERRRGRRRWRHSAAEISAASRT